MAKDLAKLVVSLEAESSKMRAELEKANGKLDKFGKKANSVSNGVKKAFKSLGGVLVGAGIVAGLTSLTRGAIDSADQVQKLSQRLGASTEALSEYKHVAELTGVTFQQITTSWQRMTRRIAEAAQGTGEARDAIAELGLAAGDLKKLAPEQQFEVLADAIMSVEEPADRVRIAMKLFDSEGVALIQTMQGGSESMQGMREEARRLGLSMSKEMVDASAAANDAMTKLGASTDALGLTLARNLAPAIQAAVEWFTDSVPSAIDFTKLALASAREAFAGFSSWLTNALADAEYDLAAIADFFGADKLSAAFTSAGDRYREMGDTWSRVADNMSEAAATSSAKTISAVKQTVSYADLYDASLKETSQSSSKATKSSGTLAKSIDKVSSSTRSAKSEMSSFASSIAATHGPAVQLVQDLASIQRAQMAAMASGASLGGSIASNLERVDADVSKLSFNAAQTVESNMQQATYSSKETEMALRDAYYGASEAAQEFAPAAVDSIDQMSDAAEDFGQAIGGAFENAIIEGESFGDVLKALEKDILRIFTRQLVTNPISQMLSSGLGSMGTGSVINNVSVTTPNADSFIPAQRHIGDDLAMAMMRA